MAALALVLAGAALMMHAHLGMRDLATSRVTLAEGEYYMNRYNTYSSRSTVGATIIVAGALVGLYALIRHTSHRDTTVHAEENSPRPE